MSQVRWHDPKKALWAVGLVVPSLTFIGIGMHALTGWGAWLWIGPLFVLGTVPIIDLVAGRDVAGPPDDAIAALEADRYYRWVTYLYLPLQYVGFVLGCFVIARGGLSTSESVGLAITLGFVGGIGINTAHELGHKREENERRLAKVALAQSGYGHFYIEHNRGHHVRVATPEDPASSRLGEGFYRYWCRTVSGSIASAWSLESRRLRLRDRRALRWDNDILSAWLLTAVLWVGLLAWLGIGLLPYVIIQALIAITLLEAVNYLEHYGLLRQRVTSGDRVRYERVDASHSWNSNNVATNVLLYHLQRHSDHHANPTRRYQALRDEPAAPVLPTGYAGMILLALVPPLWRRVMDPRVAAHYGGDLTRANRGIAPEPAGATAAAQRLGDPSAVACPGCGYTYVAALGDIHEGLAPGTPWSAVADDWCCPDCGVRSKQDFILAANHR